MNRRGFICLLTGAIARVFLPKTDHYYVNQESGFWFKSPERRSDLDKTLFKYYSNSLMATLLKRNTDFSSMSICKPLPAISGNKIQFFTYRPSDTDEV